MIKVLKKEEKVIDVGGGAPHSCYVKYEVKKDERKR